MVQVGHPFRQVLLVCLAIAVTADHHIHRGSEASQQPDSVCARSCHYEEPMRTNHDERDYQASPLHPHYAPRVTYRYFYEGEAVTRAEVVDDMDSRLGVRAFVNLVANTPCDMKIKIEDMELTNVRPEDSSGLRASFEEHDLHFSFRDGRIDELCPHVDEDPRALNFKRAILSSLQTTLSSSVFQPGVSQTTHVLETDATGQCRTKYVVDSPRADGFFTLNKTKEECLSTGAFPYIPHTHYTSDFDRSHHSPRMPTDAEDPIYRHDQQCHMTLEGGIWQSVECHELVGIRSVNPSSSAGQLATVQLHSNLQLHSTLQDEQQDPTINFRTEGRRERQGLQMSLEPIRDLKEVTVTPDEVGVTLSHLVATVTADSGMLEERTHKFSILVHHLSHMRGKENFDRLLREYINRDYYKEFLLDALALCETKECFKVTSSLAEKEMDHRRVHLWLGGLHFAKNPAVESIESLMNLVKSGAYSDEALMATSSLVFRLCREQDKCNLNVKGKFRPQPHRAFLDYVEEGLGNDCGYGEPSQYANIVLLLKALSNSGIDLENSKLRKCYMNKMHSRDVRVAALTSFRRRYDCNEDKDELWHLLEDMHEDVAVRIESYKVLQTCADHYSDFYGRIKGLLLTEEVNQVGSYIWTHVRNLARSSSIEREPVSVLANHHYLLNKFDTNSFKQSKNYHSSFHSNTMDLGGSIDSNVVFTPDSFLPYYANLNLTVNVLHNSFNPIEVGGNLHGFERHIRRLFERGSYFSNDRISEFLDNLKRQKRSTEDNKIDELQHVYDEAKTHMEASDDEEQDPTFFVRIFGNEVLHFDARNPSLVFRNLDHLFRLLEKPVSVQLFDQEYVAPTILGFPLRMRLNSTSSYTVHKEINETALPGVRHHFQARLIPSTSVTFDESLGVEAYVASSAMRRTITAVSRSDFGLLLSGKSLADFEIGLEVPNNEIAKLSTTSKLLFYDSSHSSWDNYTSRSIGNEMLSCSGEYTRQPLGVEVCASAVAGPSGFGSLEPFAAELVLSKIDTFNQYLFVFNSTRNRLKMNFNTPGSSINRRFGFDLEHSDPNNLKAEVYIQDKSYGLLGQAVVNYDYMSTNFRFTEDSTTHINFTHEIRYPLSPHDGNSSFMIDLMYFGHNYGIKTFTAYSPTRFDYNGTLYGFSAEPYEMKGHFVSNLQQYFTGIRGDGKEVVPKNDITLEVLAEFSVHGMTKKTQIEVSGTKLFENRFNKWSGDLQVENTLLTDIKLQGDYQLMLSPEEADLQGTIVLNGNEVSTHGRWYHLRKDDSYDFQVSLETKCDRLELDYSSQAIIKISPTATHLKAELNLKDVLVAKGSTMFAFQKSPLLLQAGLHLQYQDVVIRFLHELDFSQDDRFDIVLEATMGEFSAGTVTRASWPQDKDWDMEFNSHVRFDSTREASFVTTRALSAAKDKYSAQTMIKYGTNFIYWTEDGVWSPEKKSFTVGCDQNFLVSVILQTSPMLDAQVRIDFAGEPEPAFQMGLTQTQPSQAYELFFRPGTEDLPSVEASVALDNNSFRGSLAAGNKSKAVVEGIYAQGEGDNLHGQATLLLQTPDGQSYSSQVKLEHTYDGKTRDIKLLGLYEDQELTADLTILSHDGWFSYDSFGFSLEVETPFELFRSSHLAFETHGHSSRPSFMELHVADYKFRGDVKFAGFDDIELAITYEDGGHFDSRMRLHHACDGETLRTGASLQITPNYALPWAFELYGQNGYGGYLEHSLKFQLNLSSPMFQAPIKIEGQHKSSSSSFNILLALDGGEQAKFHLTGNHESLWSGDEISAKFDLELPSSKPITFDMKSFFTGSTFTVESKLNTFWKVLDSVNLKGNFSHSNPEKFMWNLNLHLPDYELRNKIDIDLESNHISTGLEMVIHEFLMTLSLKSMWDIFLPQAHADLSFRMQNGDHYTYQLTYDLATEEDNYVNTLTMLSHDGELLHIVSNIQCDNITNWSADAEITVPALSPSIYNVGTDVKGDYNSLIGTFTISPLWEEKFAQSFTFVNEDEKVSIEISSSLGTEKILHLRGDLDANEMPERLKFNVDLDISVLSNISLSWAHDFGTTQYITANMIYGNYNGLFIHNLISSANDEFQAYEMELKLPVGNDARFEIGVEGYSNYTGSFEMHFSEHNIILSSNYEKGLIGKLTLIGPDYDYIASIQHSKQVNGERIVFLQIQEFQSPLLIATMNIASLFPTFDVSLTWSFQEKTLDLEFICDLSHAENNNVVASLTISSDYETLKDVRFMANGTFDYMDDSVLKMTLEADGHLKTDGMNNEGKMNFNLQANTNLRELTFNTKTLYSLESYGIHEEGIESDINFALWDHFESSFQLLKEDYYNPSLSVNVNLNHINLDARLTLFGSTYQIAATKEKRNSFKVEFSKADEGSTPTKATLEVKWLFRQVMQINFNGQSDFGYVTKILGKIKGNPAKQITGSLKILSTNKESFTAVAKYDPRKSDHSSATLIIKLKNTIIDRFQGTMKLDYALQNDRFESDLTVSKNRVPNLIKNNIRYEFYDSLSISADTPWFDLDFGLDLSANPSLSFSFSSKSLDLSFHWGTEEDYQKMECKAEIDIKKGAVEYQTYDFKLSYNVATNDKAFDFSVRGNNQTFISTMIRGQFKADDYDIKSEISVFDYIRLGVKANYANSPMTLNLVIYDLDSQDPYLTADFGMAPTTLTFEANVVKEYYISATVEYNLEESEFSLEGRGSVQLSDFEMTFTVDVSGKDSSGQLEIYLETTNANYESFKFTSEYDFRSHDIKAISYNFEGSAGNSTGNLKIEVLPDKLNTFVDIEVTMIFPLTLSFQLTLDPEAYAMKMMAGYFWVSATGKYEYSNNNIGISGEIKTNHLALDNLNFILELKKLANSDMYQGTARATIDKWIDYGITFAHKNSPSWAMADTTVKLIVFGEMSGLRISYDFEEKYAAGLFLAHHDKWLGAKIGYAQMQSDHKVDLNLDLTYFDKGEYQITSQFHTKELSNPSNLHISRRKYPTLFSASTEFEDAFRVGKFTFESAPMDDSSHISSSSFTYNTQQSRSLTVRGHHENYTMEGTMDLTGKENPWTSMVAVINTNVDGYKNIDAHWKVGDNDTLFVDVVMDIKEKGKIQLIGSLDYQPKGMKIPWRRTIFKASFVSPFTLSHEVNVDYHIDNFNSYVSYQYGLEKFEMDVSTKSGAKWGFMKIIGNTPIPYVSDFNFEARYNVKKSYKIEVNSNMESTTFNIACDLLKDFTKLELKSEFISPLFTSLQGNLVWEILDGSKGFEYNIRYGLEHNYMMKMKFTHSEDFGDGGLSLAIDTPFEKLTSLSFEGTYHIVKPIGFDLSLNIGINKETISALVKTLYKRKVVTILLEGKTSFYNNSSGKILGNINLAGKPDLYDTKWKVTWMEQHSTQLIFKLDKTQLSVLVEYENEPIFSINMNRKLLEFEVGVRWQQRDLFLAKGNLQNTPGRKLLAVEMTNHKIETMRLTVQYNHLQEHTTRAELETADANYTLDTVFDIGEKKSLLKMKYESSNDPHNIISAEFQFDIAAFIDGQMNSMEDLLSFEFTWGDRLAFILRGMHNGDRIKVQGEISTPFWELPVLRFGFDGELMVSEVFLDITGTMYVEWNEKILVTGSLQSKDGKFNFQGTLETPLQFLQKLSITLLISPNNIESIVLRNENEWKSLIKYNFDSSPFEMVISAATPLPNLEEIDIAGKMEFDDSFLSTNLVMQVNGKELINFDAEAEYWKLQITLETSWAPLSKVQLSASLSTESEDITAIGRLQLQDEVYESMSVLRILEDSASIKFKFHENGFETIRAIFSIIHEGNAESLQVYIDSEYNIINGIIFKISLEQFNLFETASGYANIGMDFILPIQKFKLSINGSTENFGLQSSVSVNLEWNNDYIKSFIGYSFGFPYMLQLSVHFPLAREPFSFSFKASIPESQVLLVFNKNKFNIMYEVVGSGHIKTLLEFRLEGLPVVEMEGIYLMANGFTPDAELKIILQLTIYAFEDSLAPDFESMVNCHYYYQNQKLNIEGHFKAFQQMSYEVSAHVVIPTTLTDTFEWGLRLSNGDVILFKLTYMHSISNPYSTISFKAETITTEAVFLLNLDLNKNVGSITFSFPNTSESHSLLITWNTEDPTLKLSINIESVYLSEGVLNVKLTLNNSNNFAVKVEAEYGAGHDLMFTLEFDHHEWSLTYSLSMQSNYFGNVHSECDLKWLSILVINFDLDLLEEVHHAQLTLSKTGASVSINFKLKTPKFPGKILEMTGKLSTTDEWSNGHLQVSTLLGEKEINSKGHYTWQKDEFNVSFGVEHEEEEIVQTTLVAVFDHRWNINFELSSSNLDYNGSHFHVEIEPSWPFTASFRAGTPNKFLQIYIDLRDRTGIAWVKHDLEQKTPLAEFTYDFQDNRMIFTAVSSQLRTQFFMTIDYQNNFNFQLHLATPFTNKRLFEISFYAPLEMLTRNDYAYGFHISTMEYSLGLHGTVQLSQMPYEITLRVSGEENYDLLHLEYEDGDRKAAIALLSVPNGTIGFKFVKDFRSWYDCDLTAAIHIPIEGYDFLSLRYVIRPGEIALECRISNIGFGIELTDNPVNSVTKITEIRVKFNENVSVLRFKIQVLDFSREFPSFFKFLITIEQTEFPRSLGSNNLEICYDENEHIYLVLGKDGVDDFKIYLGWGKTKGAHILWTFLTPQIEIKVLSTDKEDNFIIRYSSDFEKYGIYFNNKALTGGQKVHIAGEVPDSKLGLTLSLAIDPTYFENSIIIDLDNHEFGYCIKYDSDNYPRKSFIVEVMIMMKDFHPYFKIALFPENKYSSFSATFDYEPGRKSPIQFYMFNDDSRFLGAGLIESGARFIFRETTLALSNFLVIHSSGKFYGLVELRNFQENTRNYSLEYDWTPIDGMAGNGVSHLVLKLPLNRALFNATVATRNSKETKGINIVIDIDVGSLDMPTQTSLNFSRTEKDGDYDVLASFSAEGGSTYDMVLRTNELVDRGYMHMHGRDQVMNDTWSVRAGTHEDLPHVYLEYDIGDGESSSYESRSLKIGLIDPNNLGIFLNHELFGNLKNDFQASLSLENQDSLRISCTFDPAIRYITSDLGTLMHFVSPMDKILFPVDLDLWLHDLEYKVALAMNKFYSPVELTSLRAALEREIKTMTNRLRDAYDYTSIIWKENKFFVQDLTSAYYYTVEMVKHLGSHITKSLDTLMESTQESFLQLANALTIELYYQVNRSVEEFEPIAKGMMYALVKQINWTMGQVMQALEPIYLPAFDWIHSLFTDLHKYNDEIKDSFSDLSERIYSFLGQLTPAKDALWEFVRGDEFVSFFSETGYLQELYEYPYRFIDDGTREMLASFENSQIKAFFVQAWNTDLGSAVQWQEWVQLMLDSIFAVLQALPEFRSHPVVDYINAVTGDSLNRLVELWVDTEAEREAAMQIVTDLFRFINNVLDFDSPGLTVDEEIFSPEKGILLNYVQYLPVPWASLTQSPQWSSLEDIVDSSSEERVKRMLALTLQETEGGWLAAGRSGSWFPPFIATASIIGQQVTTFDQHHFEFLGTCSYLLTRDFHGKSFDLVGHYQSEQGVVSLESVTLKTPEKVMRLTVDGRLFIDENQMEIPYDSEATHMVSRTSSGVHMTYNEDVLVSCWPATKGCSVTVSGKFFGRVAGLLGNFNNEPGDDLQGPGQTDTYSIRHFSSLWAVSDRPCYSANYAIQSRMKDYSIDDDCHKVFLSKFSPLRECFSSVDPTPYFWRCVNDMSKTTSGYEEEKDACPAAKGYSLQCFTQGILVPQLKECKRCVTSSGESVKVGWKERVETSATSKDQADIAILLETAKCNDKRDMVGLVTALGKALKNEGKTNVRFAFIPFHRDSKPTPAQKGGEVFHALNDIRDLIKGIDYKFRASVEGRSAAIHLASELPWRAGASHSVILVSCSPCQPSDPGQFQDLLKAQGISLHLISKTRFEYEAPNLKKSKAIAAKILGFDSTAAYTVKDYVKFNGDENILAAMKVEDDVCVTGALESKGSVFNSLKWVPKKVLMVKKMMRVVASRIAKDKAEEGKCQVCQCQLDELESTQIVCKECSQMQTGMLDPADRETDGQMSMLKSIKQDFEKNFRDVGITFPPKWNRDSSGHEEESSESDESDESSEELELDPHA